MASRAAERRQRAQELRAALSRVTRDGLGRFVEIKKLKTCSDASCDLGDLEDAGDWRGKFVELDNTLEAIELMLRADDPEMRQAALDVFYDVRAAMREDAERIEREEARYSAQRMSEAFRASMEDADKAQGGWYAWVSGQDVPDSMDVTGLEPADARRLALALMRMNRRKGQRPRGGQKVYVWRNGKRHVNPGLLTVNLHDPVITELGLDVALWDLVKDGRLSVEYEEPDAAVA